MISRPVATESCCEFVCLFAFFLNINKMFKLFVLTTAIVLCCVHADEELTVENCKCQAGFEAQKDPNGKIQCSGILLNAIKSCNVPEAPKCVCTETVTGIVSDADGTWCTFSEKGENKKKWPCENKDEWDAFKIAQDEYEQKLKLPH